MDVKSLRKAYKENEKQISKLLDQYSSRYTTKANKSIYNLMVIALRAEIQQQSRADHRDRESCHSLNHLLLPWFYLVPLFL